MKQNRSSLDKHKESGSIPAGHTKRNSKSYFKQKKNDPGVRYKIQVVHRNM